MSSREIYLAHELDAAWIIALWKAIHGGDPGPEQIAAQAIAALAQYVAPSPQVEFTFTELRAQFGKLGVQVSKRTEEAAKAGARTQLAMPEEGDPESCVHQYCFKLKGETFCTVLPVLAHLPTAA